MVPILLPSVRKVRESAREVAAYGLCSYYQQFHIVDESFSQLVSMQYRLTPATLPYRIIVTVLGLGVIVLVVIKLFIHDGDLGIYYGIFISLAASIAVIVGGVMLSRERSEGAAAVEPKDRAHSLR
jgi:hypothetical protein